jgi:hypothetical protein
MNIEQHCLKIIQSPQIKNRIVILCEGKIPDLGRFSPSAYGKNDHLPDANFYKACLPQNWRSKLPVFFNSGSRSEVLKTYQTLIKIHSQHLEISRLTPDKIFVLLDIDLQSEDLQNYAFDSIDIAFQDLFTQHQINIDRLQHHRIWFTGFIHKEAYFLAPELQEFFDTLADISYYPGCAYQNNPLSLNHVYQDMAKDLTNDQDLVINWHRATNRINHYKNLNLDTPEKLQQSWQNEWSSSLREGYANDEQTKQLIYTLLTIRKVKPYWENIHPSNEPATNNCKQEWQSFRDDISLLIGRRVYAHQEGKPHQHLACFFKYLYQLEFG